MTGVVSDVSANRNEKIYNAAEFLGRSSDRRKVFEAVYKGKKDKTVGEIMDISKIGDLLNRRMRTLQELKKLRGDDMVDKLDEKRDGQIVYRKKDFYTNHWKKILFLSINKEKRDKIPTKISPKISAIKYIRINIPIDRSPKIKQVTIDDIDSFSKVKKTASKKKLDIYEKDIKILFKKILEERGEFTDWGGEKNDLFTTRLNFKRKRCSAVFGFKGKGTRPPLTPGKMGKNGDQIQRLFSSPADFFFVQFVGQINESVIEQMKAFAIARSISDNKKIYFGVIDGSDTNRIFEAYG